MKEIIINYAPPETRITITEDSALVEFLIERKREKGIAGNIYKGKVARVLPGMQAAFVDIGLDKAAFLHVSDLTAGPGDLHPLLTGSEDEIDFEHDRRWDFSFNIGGPRTLQAGPRSIYKVVQSSRNIKRLLVYVCIDNDLPKLYFNKALVHNCVPFRLGRTRM